MSSTRRDFLQRSASAAAVLTLGTVERSAATTPLLADDALRAATQGVKFFEARMLKARPVPLNRVRVLGGPLKHAQDLTAKYLLELEPDRMLAFYRVRAGLPQKAEPYAGWDGAGRNLTGHIAGHHLSAVSLMYLATGDERFKARADHLVRELREVQEKNGDGYLGAIDGAREAFASLSRGEIRSAAFDLNGMWSPWYTLHKTYAGLRDAWRHTGNRTALDLEVKFAGWAERVLAPLNGTQIASMLNTEHGGMNEVLADLYADTGDTRWLDLSHRFEHHAFTGALKRHQDNLNGKHGNCQIPKLIGSAVRYGYAGDAGDIVAASYFWDRVTQHHSYATGGHGLAEYFGAPDQLSERVDGRTCETCNVYNMLKLTRRLFSFRPDAVYADFHERALFNHILASIDDETGRTSYMVPVGRGVQQEYQDMLQSFTCCVGTGMESHALHGDGLYYESDDALWVNLFVPSTARFTTAGLHLRMETDFPDGEQATITLELPSPRELTLAVRRPHWAGDAFRVRVNGASVEQPALASLRAGAAGGRNVVNEDTHQNAGSFVELKRTWRRGDKVELTLPKSVRLEACADNKSVAAIMWGPLVLAGDMGPRREGRNAEQAAPVPVLVAAERPLTDWIVPTGTRAGDFRASQVGRVPAQPAPPTDVTLTPFHRTHRRNYSVYFDVVTPANFDTRVAAVDAERERVRRLEAATVAFVQPGTADLEREFSYRSEPADRPVQRGQGRSGRGGSGWFSYDLPVEPTSPIALVVTYLNDLGLPPTAGDFEVLVEGSPIAKFSPNVSATGFYEARYEVPAGLVGGKARVTVRFQASANGRIAPVFGVRVIRAN
ncbi:MAG: beta-L-arabinofuranosidase domain-containing protein [Gemmatimonadaceae bacterium]